MKVVGLPVSGKIARVLNGLAAVSLVAGCTQASAPPLPASAVAAQNAPYKLGVGDKLRILVYGEPTLSGEYRVSGGGVITMPLVGEVPAAGLSVADLDAALVAKFGSGYLKNPKLAIELYEFRPFSILGQVAHPGRFPATEDMSVAAAVAAAGGFTYRANTTKVFIRRAGDAREYAVNADADVKVQPGDVIRVGERYF